MSFLREVPLDTNIPVADKVTGIGQAGPAASKHSIDARADIEYAHRRTLRIDCPAS